MMSLLTKFKRALGLIVVLSLAACGTTNTPSGTHNSAYGVLQSN